MQNEVESSLADTPEVAAAKQQMTQAFAGYLDTRDTCCDLTVSTALEAIVETVSSEGEPQSASHVAEDDDASDSDGEGKVESNDAEEDERVEGESDNEEGEGEEGEDEEEEDEAGEFEVEE